MKIYKDITELIGHTPLVELSAYSRGEDARIVAKLERNNPGGSSKDRIALAMIEDGEKRGIIKKGGIIIEPTSGNTGIGLAAVGAAKGYHVILTMPETMSVERQKLLRAYGAEIVLTEGSKGMLGAVDKAVELAENMEGAFLAGQFENPANPEAHKKTTGPEIWEDTEGTVDIFVASVGTGGTLTGAGEYLKSMNERIKVIAVEPASSPLLSQGHPGPHKIQGIGANFVPEVLDRALIDEVIPVTDDQAYKTAARLARQEGLLCGISSGAALYAAQVIGERPENKGKTIVVFFPDTGERYLSTTVFK